MCFKCSISKHALSYLQCVQTTTKEKTANLVVLYSVELSMNLEFYRLGFSFSLRARDLAFKSDLCLFFRTL